MGRGRPRVIPSIVDLTQRVSPSLSYRAATILPAPQGPVGEAVLVSSYTEFKTIFGKPINLVKTPGHYQVLSWFRNGGGALYVVRNAQKEIDSAIPATMSFSLGSEDATITFEAKEAGIRGNLISFDAFSLGDNQELLVSVIGNRIRVSLATNANGEITTKASDLKLALDNSEASNLVSVTIEGVDSTLMEQVGQTYLAGGAPGEAYTDGTSKCLIPIRTRKDSIKILSCLVQETSDFEFAGEESENFDILRIKEPSAGVLDIQFIPILDGVKYSPNRMHIEVRDLSGGVLEQFEVSTFDEVKDGDGMSMYIGDVLLRSRYLEFVQNPTQEPEPTPKTFAHDEPEFDSPGKLISDDYFDAWRLLEYVPDETIADETLEILTDTSLDYWVIFNSLDNKQAILATRGMSLTKERCVAALATLQYSASDYISRITGSGSEDFSLISASGDRSITAAGILEVYDGDNNREVRVHGAGVLAALICRAWTNDGIHKSPGGVNRGGLNVHSIYSKFNETDQDELFDARINYFVNDREYGPVLKGQKTLVNRDCAFDRLNVTATIMYSNDALQRMLTAYIEETNDERTRLLITISAEQFLSSLQASGAIYDAFVVCDTSNNTPDVIDDNRLIFEYYVKPSKTIDWIEMRAIVTPTGVDFSSLL